MSGRTCRALARGPFSPRRRSPAARGREDSGDRAARLPRAARGPLRLERPSTTVAEELFRRRVLKLLVDRGKLDEDAAAGLLIWQRSGFSVHNSIRVEPDDREGLERLCHYLVHPPIALVSRDEMIVFPGLRSAAARRRQTLSAVRTRSVGAGPDVEPFRASKDVEERLPG